MSLKQSVAQLHPETLDLCKSMQSVIYRIGIQGIRNILDGLDALSPDSTSPSAEQLDEALNYARACAVGEPVSERQFPIVFVDSSGNERLRSVGYLIARNDQLAVWIGTGKAGETVEVYTQLNGTPLSEIARIDITEFFHVTHVDAYDADNRLWCNENQDWV